MPDSSNNQEGFCGSKKCKTLSIIAVIILIIIIIAIAVPISLAGCKTGYTGEECDVCDTGYHMDNHGLCKGLKISFRTQISLKIRRDPKLEGCAFANFGNSSGTEGEPSQIREKNGGKKKKNQCCRDREMNPGLKQ